MKKLLVLLLALVMCIACFTACGVGGNGGNGSGDDEVTYDVSKAVTFVRSLYIGEEVKADGAEEGVITKYADFKRVSVVNIARVAYSVEWSVDITDETKVKVVAGTDGADTVIDVNEKTAEDITFVLTATVKAGDGTSGTVSFNVLVPKYEVISYDDYRAKADGESATIEGIVVAMNSKSEGNKRNHLFLVDAAGKGGYYAYDMADDPVKDLGIKVGMTVAVSGEIDIYNGMYELKDATARIINSEISTPAALDVTDKYAAGENILNYVGALITIKGVEIGNQDLATETSQYLYFSLNGVESYIRTYVTDLPTSFDIEVDEDGNTSCAAKASIDSLHGEKYGWTADVTGVLIAYNGAPYLMPVDANCFNYLQLVEKTDEEKLAIELDNVKIDSSFGNSCEVELSTSGSNYSDVVISYASDNAAIVVDGGKLTITVGDETVIVNITVTATLNGKSDSKTVEVKLSKEPTPIKDIAALEDGASVIVKGVVVEIKSAWSDKYGNMDVWIWDGTGKIQAFRTTTLVKVGDQITLTGTVGSYNGTKQIAAGSTSVIDVEGPAEATTIPAILETEDGVYVMFSGTVDEIKDAWSDKYGNISVWITDGTNRILAYRTTTNLEVGDIVTIFGNVGSYNGAKQIAAKSYAYVTGKAPAEEEGDDNTEGGDNGSTEGTTANVVIGDYAIANIWENSKLYDTITVAGVATITCGGTATGNYGLNTGKYYTNGHNWRIYQAETPSLVITAVEGKTIISVKITYASQNTGVLTLDGANVESDQVVSVNGTTVTFSVGNTGSATNGQARITAIEIIYA